MPTITRARALNHSYSPSSMPVAIFVGGTSGIGRAMAESLARVTKGNCHIILIGRNRAAAESIIASFPKSSAGPEAPMHEFVQCDATLIKNVHATTKGLSARLQKVNFLVLSPGLFRASGRHDTTEGIDEQLVLSYYARWTFAYDLMRLLVKAKDAGEDAKVMSVLAAGLPMGVQADLNDLGMKNSWVGAVRVAPTYNDLMIEKFSALNPSLSFTHIQPGPVRTPFLLPKASILGPILYTLLWPFAVSQSACAEYMWYTLHNAGPGSHRRGPKGEDLGNARYRGTPEAREALWLHTLEATMSTSDS